MMIFSSLDLVEYKEIQRKNRSTQSEEFLGLLMPFYDYEYDIGTFGFIGNNGFKFICVKKIDNSVQEVSSNIKLKEIFTEIHEKLIKSILNPFNDKKDFLTNNQSTERENFKDKILGTLKAKQIY